MHSLVGGRDSRQTEQVIFLFLCSFRSLLSHLPFLCRKCNVFPICSGHEGGAHTLSVFCWSLRLPLGLLSSMVAFFFGGGGLFTLLTLTGALCLKQLPRPLSAVDRHVLQPAFGGYWPLPLVMATGCNQWAWPLPFPH